jgi:3-oxoacyl-[acyl-carrier protein] reductase
MEFSLQKKTAFVCGSTQGIGKAIALELAQNGASVVLLGRNAAKLNSVLNELDNSQGQEHHFIKADFSFPNELKVKVEEYVEEHRAVHILVNNTGGPPSGPALSATAKNYTDAFSNHLICNHIMVKELSEGMKEANYGRIINIISTSVKEPIQGLGVSNTIRGAVASWAKTWANEVGPSGITVNNVLPGATNTSRLDEIVHSKAEKTGQSAADVRRQMASAVPLKRTGEPEEVARAIAFLASPSANYISGINLPVDGGRTLSL